MSLCLHTGFRVKFKKASQNKTITNSKKSHRAPLHLPDLGWPCRGLLVVWGVKAEVGGLASFYGPCSWNTLPNCVGCTPELTLQTRNIPLLFMFSLLGFVVVLFLRLIILIVCWHNNMSILWCFVFPFEWTLEFKRTCLSCIIQTEMDHTMRLSCFHCFKVNNILLWSDWIDVPCKEFNRDYCSTSKWRHRLCILADFKNPLKWTCLISTSLLFTRSNS